MTDTIELKIKEYGRSKFMCATCNNNITELRAMKFPICDDCLKALREIIKERRFDPWIGDINVYIHVYS